ncbi:MAG: hypothetical protein KAR62_04105 [Sphingomonadales bacterium]|nr:hypothetical protein [Sphingomonadales bacterium]
MTTSTDSGRHEKAHQYWLSLLSGRAMPTIADLTAEQLSEFKTHSFLVAIVGHDKSPVVSFAGKEIFAGDGASALKAGTSLDTVAPDSLLASLATEFSEIQNSFKPIEFDAGLLGGSLDHPSIGMLMPFGASGSVQFVWGVLSDPEVDVAAPAADLSFDADPSFDSGADGASQFDEALSEDGGFEAEDAFEHPVTEDDFNEKERLSGFDVYADSYEGEAFHISDIATSERSDLGIGDVPSDIYLGFDDRADSFEGEAYEMSEVVTEESSIVFYDEDSGFDQGEEVESDEGFAGSIAEVGEETGFDGFADVDDAPSVAAIATEPEEEPVVETEDDTPEPEELEEENDVPFFNVLADGRTAADGVVHVDQRSRLSLYDVLAKAFALYEQSQQDRDTYLSILKATGIREQLRAPFTPIIKLVFGKEFDKTRITEYAAALSFARRNGQTSETLSGFLANQPGGIKGCVQAERISKREDKGIAGDVVLEAAKEKLRSEKAIGKVEVDVAGDDEFVLLLGRRGSADGVVEIIKPLTEKRSFVDPVIKRAIKPNKK